MKKIITLFIAVIITAVACQPKKITVAVDIESEKAAITTLFEKYNKALISKEIDSLALLITENSLSCGTDPSEFWNKEEILDLWNQMVTDTSLKINYSIDKREIRVDEDGQAALVIEQYVMHSLSPKIPVRSIYHAVKNDGKWMINFISWNFIPYNNDIPRLNKALEEKSK